MLEVNDLNVSYGGRQILKNVNLCANKGEIIGIIGPNGSGKTTFLKSIAKYLKPDSGTIRIDKKNIYNMESKEIARNVAVVSQVVSIDFEFPVREVVLMGRTPYINGREKSEDLEIVEDALKKTNTYEFRNRLVTHLSGGELQRVIIARALAQTPRVLLLDEPTSHLDITHQVEIFDMVKDAACRGLLVIAVIHDLNLAAHYCNRICMIKSGEIISVGVTESVFTEKNLEQTFDIPVEIARVGASNSLCIIPLIKDIKDTKALIP